MKLTPVVLLVFCNFVYAQDCNILSQIRNYARTNFAAISPEVRSYPAKVKAAWLLPNAQSCMVQKYSSVDGKYTCEWALIKEQENKDLAISIYNDFVGELAGCANSATKIDNRQSKKENTGSSARFIDSNFQSLKREAFIAVRLDYSDHWWTMTMDYSINDKDE